MPANPRQSTSAKVLTLRRTDLKLSRLRFAHHDLIGSRFHVDINFNGDNVAFGRLRVSGTPHDGQANERRREDTGRGATEEERQSHGQHGRRFGTFRRIFQARAVAFVTWITGRDGDGPFLDLHHWLAFEPLEDDLASNSSVGDSVNRREGIQVR